MASSIASAADTWLCIGEHGAQVTNDANGVTGSEAFLNEQKWLLDDKGFRKFGSDAPFLSDCTITDGTPRFCEYPGQLWGGVFILNAGNVFTLVGTSVDGENVSTYVIKGICSKLSPP